MPHPICPRGGAHRAFQEPHGVLVAPRQGVQRRRVRPTSGQEMRPELHAARAGPLRKVAQKVHTIMRNIYHNAANAAAENGMEGHSGWCRRQHRGLPHAERDRPTR